MGKNSVLGLSEPEKSRISKYFYTHEQGFRELLKTEAFGLGFQQLLRDLANVVYWKTMFDRRYSIILTKYSVTFAKNVALYFVNVGQ